MRGYDKETLGPGRHSVKAWMRWHARYGYARDIVKGPAKYLHSTRRRLVERYRAAAARIVRETVLGDAA